MEAVLKSIGTGANYRISLLLDFIREMSWEDHQAFDQRVAIEQAVVENYHAYTDERVGKARELLALLEKV